jgi:hypothetical protein
MNHSLPFHYCPLFPSFYYYHRVGWLGGNPLDLCSNLGPDTSRPIAARPWPLPSRSFQFMHIVPAVLRRGCVLSSLGQVRLPWQYAARNAPVSPAPRLPHHNEPLTRKIRTEKSLPPPPPRPQVPSDCGGGIDFPVLFTLVPCQIVVIRR